MGLFRKGKIGIIAKFHRTDLVICSHSRGTKTPSYSRINTVAFKTKKPTFIGPPPPPTSEAQLAKGWIADLVVLSSRLPEGGNLSNVNRVQLHTAFLTVKILCIGTDRSQQTVQTKIRLLLQKQSDQGLRCLPLHQLLLDAFMQCYIKLYQF